MSAFYTPVFERSWVERTRREAEAERRRKEDLVEYIPDPQEEPQNE
jgi:hypothetical protein